MWNALRKPQQNQRERLPLKITVEDKSKQNQVCRANDNTEKKQHAHVKTMAQKKMAVVRLSMVSLVITFRFPINRKRLSDCVKS